MRELDVGKRKVITIGCSQGIVIPPVLCELFKKGSYVNLKLKGNELIITAVKETEGEQ